MIRFYPNPEGHHALNGTPYEDVPQGSIRIELNKFIQELQKICATKKFTLIIESLNHGEHVGNSMHFKGLALDFNIKSPVIIKSDYYLEFKAQAELAVDAILALDYDKAGFDAWLWVSDPDDKPTHTHLSIHPPDAKGPTLARTA